MSFDIREKSLLCTVSLALPIAANFTVFTTPGSVVFPFQKNKKLRRISASSKNGNGTSVFSFLSFLKPLDVNGNQIPNNRATNVSGVVGSSNTIEIIHNTNYPFEMENFKCAGMLFDYVFTSRTGDTTTTLVDLVFVFEFMEEEYVEFAP